MAHAPSSNIEKMKPRYLISALLGALLIAYPLSVGPAWWLLQHSGRAPERYLPGLLLIYKPLSVLSDHVPVLQSFMMWYVRLWI